MYLCKNFGIKVEGYFLKGGVEIQNLDKILSTSGITEDLVAFWLKIGLRSNFRAPKKFLARRVCPRTSPPKSVLHILHLAFPLPPSPNWLPLLCYLSHCRECGADLKQATAVHLSWRPGDIYLSSNWIKFTGMAEPTHFSTNQIHRKFSNFRQH